MLTHTLSLMAVSLQGTSFSLACIVLYRLTECKPLPEYSEFIGDNYCHEGIAL
ncbi:MAG TPA: hypothetical protein PK029_00585 [Bacteroidales bacterium]|nr:hypothetical protein [Bacteroidales bacterium]HPM12334.1 hypothetical protein [Bacteroidales bacterium]